MTIVCGDSHTSTHGAFGALAFGIGTSEVEHVLATQTLPQNQPRTMAITVDGDLPPGVTAKDVILGDHRPDRHRRRHRPRHRVPRRGHPRALDGGPHDGLQHVDRGRRARRHGRARRHDLRVPRGPPSRAAGRRLGARARPLALAPTDPDATFDREVRSTRPSSARTSPGARTRRRPSRSTARSPTRTASTSPATARRPSARSPTWASSRARRSGTSGSTRSSSARCTNSRIEDLRAAAEVVRAAASPHGLRAMVVPGSVP